ncbi:unnamed protein product, partial [Anisakis simplex]|uniref:Secreted mucin muc17 n=1 Tax=Anisakis simplex TaxID=6269 RepID=A0A0M3JMV4_ANISI
VSATRSSLGATVSASERESATTASVESTETTTTPSEPSVSSSGAPLETSETSETTAAAAGVESTAEHSLKTLLIKPSESAADSHQSNEFTGERSTETTPLLFEASTSLPVGQEQTTEPTGSFTHEIPDEEAAESPEDVISGIPTGAPGVDEATAEVWHVKTTESQGFAGETGTETVETGHSDMGFREFFHQSTVEPHQ